ncbi:MAG TPA: DNA ligase D [Beijerinckia sp.]|jgi:bifunctional non-homologous end joining protein LigD|nr:DNA ligase D [Beijerinckia sp.]
MSAFVEPCLAMASRAPPSGANFVHEVKFDGYRLQAVLQNGEAVIRTRKGLDWSARFPSLARAIAALPVESGVFDGEAVVEDQNGIANFTALQDALKSNRQERIVFYLFDLLYLNGHDLKPLALTLRKKILEQVLNAAPTPSPLRYSAHFETSGKELLQHLCRLGAEGLVSKHADRPYRSGRNGDWLKIKCADRQEFIVVGYVPSTSTSKAIGSLVLGYYENGKLQHAGRAGTGFNLQTAKALFTALEKIKTGKPAIDGPLSAEAKRNVRWVEPSLVAEIEFRGWTANNMVRQAAFKALRDDKPAEEITRELAAPGEDPEEMRTSVKLTHPDRLLWPDAGFTKQGLADYYKEVWPLIAPHITGRPLALVRCPAGIDEGCFFQKHKWEGLDRHIMLIEDPEDEEPIVGIETLDGLIALAQASVLEIHPWGSKAAALETPDRLIFDLDPGEDVGFPDLIHAAREVRARLEDDGLTSFVKTSGGKGLHVVAPIEPRASWDAAKDYCRKIAESMATDNKAKFTATIAKRERKGKIFVDYLRNGRGATAVAPYSTRARSEAGISAPLGWDELDSIASAAHFTLANIGRRLQGLQIDPWQEMAKCKQSLPAS